MAAASPARIRRRVVEASEHSLSGQGYVTALDVLVGIRWLPQSAVDAWQQGRLAHLEERVQVDRAKITLALAELDLLRSAQRPPYPEQDEQDDGHPRVQADDHPQLEHHHQAPGTDGGKRLAVLALIGSGR